MSRALALVATLALSFTPQHVAATCMAAVPEAQVVEPDAQVPAGGGLLVVLRFPDDPKDRHDRHEVVQPSWKFRVHGKLVAPVIETLAPGLAIYRLPKGVTAGELVDGKRSLGKVTLVKADVQELPAPKVSKLRQQSTASRHGASTQMFADLKEAPPPGAIALVVADGKVARSFGLVGATKSVQVYDHAACGIDAKGTLLSNNGDQLKLYWIDRAGRRSPSTMIQLQATSTPARADIY